MQGTNRRVIEITETESDLIERVIVFIKPGQDVRLQRNQDKARAYVSGLCCKRRKGLRWIVCAGVALLAAVAIFLLL